MCIERWKKYFIATAAVFASAVTVAVLCFFDPRLLTWSPKCLLFQSTGIYCPGCGNTRLLYELLHGNLYAAWRCNQLTFVLLPLVAVLLLFPRTRDCKILAVVVLSVVAVFTVLRNIIPVMAIP